ncbi:shikimate dehydrogenase [Niveibacterium umoris]|uniref:Shikimate dehydrogenase (NADP(+)) n=1 Tax=Niveibacterium umoris TaxID=1193620 RepID=A0A840BQT0_9RHOO|nr:shikimate dehydrogenase [Niveibacterium umoris]MBB4013166.1 shikimate dehydrogenase [Niveibacterium umoris]
MDLYAVFGNPIAHSKSPWIHARFAEQTSQQISYEARLAPRDGFASAVAAFRNEGGRGANVTVPFKLEACALADRRSARAEAAGAANTLIFDERGITADNTDGVGLVRDLAHLGYTLEGSRVLLLGAGGAARGALLPLLAEAPSSLTIANRTVEKALALATAFQPEGRACALLGCGFDALQGSTFDVVINATSSSLSDDAPPLPQGIYAPGALAYDMMYGSDETRFMQAARELGAERLSDGLGMLVEQAAESFFLWRGVRPDTQPVREALRGTLARSS